MRSSSRAFVAALGLALSALLPPSSAAGEEVRLDEARRAALAALPLLSGDAPAAADLDGRVVVVAFFASWCPPCRPEFEHLNRAAKTYGARGLTVVAVNIFESYLKDPEGLRMKAFLAETAPRFAVVAGGEAVGPAFGSVDRIPTLYVFGRDGAEVHRFVHARGAAKTHATFEEIAAAVEPAL